MMPVVRSSVSPAGRWRAEKASGPSPVAGMRNRNGRPGVEPTTRAPWIAGRGGPPEAMGGGGSAEVAIATGRAVAPGTGVRIAPAQSA